MKRIALTTCLLLLALVMLTACADDQAATPSSSPLDKDWASIEKAARGTTVRFYMYGGFSHVNNWVDTYVADTMQQRYGITVERVPMDASVFVNKLLTEKSAGKDTGSIDLLWINGENFKSTKEGGCLFGPFADKIPNYAKHVDKELAAHDFGYPVDGYEVPYGTAQFVFEYDSARTPAPPANFTELAAWAKAHPGKFTYPQPPDFTGSAFIRQAFYALTGGADQYMRGFDQALFDKQAPKLWAYLNELKPYLWQQGRSYPKSSAELDTMFARGEVDLNMSYHSLHAQTKILDGTYPNTARTFILKDGSIFNLHFTAIPFNAPNKAGAMVLANFLLSPEAQLSKFDPANWGDFPAIALLTLPEEQQTAFAQVDLGEATLDPALLAQYAVPEIPAQYLEALEKGWEAHVLR